MGLRHMTNNTAMMETAMKTVHARLFFLKERNLSVDETQF